ncbi:hypothetical protein Tco_0454181 [Tanacetum coccineum]
MDSKDSLLRPFAAHAAWVRAIGSCLQEECQSVSSHVLKVKGYIENLERLGQPVGQNLVREVKVKEKTKMGYAHNNVPFAPKLSLPPSKKDGKITLEQRTAICHNVGEVGHRAPENGTVRVSAELMKKEEVSQEHSVSCIFTTRTYSFLVKSWIYESWVWDSYWFILRVYGEVEAETGASSLFVQWAGSSLQPLKQLETYL